MAKDTPPPRRLVVADPRAMTQLTNIDRRACSRKVPMKVLGLGVSRTGTSSLRQALLDLGFEDCYHMAAVFGENPRDGLMWIEAIKAKYEGEGKMYTKDDWDQLLGHCMAVTDTPCAWFYKELLEAYPDAKVILTLRDDPEQWWQSQMNTLIPFFDKFAGPPATWSNWLYRQFMPSPEPPMIMSELIVRHYEMYRLLLDDYRHGTKKAIQWYKDYCDEIQRIVPKNNLLVLNQKEGWVPLCRFLGKDVPGWDYPHVNTTEQMSENSKIFDGYMNMMVYLQMIKMAGAGVAAILAVRLGFAFARKSMN